MKQQRIAALGVVLVLMVPLLVAADRGASVKRVAFNRKELEPGTSWWCNTRPGTSCTRNREQCEYLGDACTEQKTAFAFSARFRGFRPGETVDGAPDVFRSKADCEAMRRTYASPASGDSDRDTKVVGLSACASVGAKPLPPLKPLPAGKGFWCFGYAVERMELSACSRVKRNCERAREVLGSGVLDRSLAPITITMECERRTTAWAFIDTDRSTRWYSDVYAGEEACEALRIGRGEPCREVR